MKTSRNLRAQALKLAAQLVKQTALTFGAAQKQAWATVKLCVQMHEQPVRFCYTKEDGTQRPAIGYYGASGQANPIVPQTGLAIRYFDTVARNWRSFRADRLTIA